MRLLVLLLVACAPVAPEISRARWERLALRNCLLACPPGARIQRRECVERYPLGVDRFEQEGRE